MNYKLARKLLGEGDIIYSASNGKPMKILEIDEEGIITEDDFLGYDEHNVLYYLHPRTFYDNRRKLKK